MIRRLRCVALFLLVALPLAAASLPGSRSWRVTLVAHAGPDSAAVARRLAAIYRGELKTPVDAEGTFLIALTDAAAAVLETDPSVQSVQVEVSDAVSSAPRVRTPAIVANGSTSWSLGDYLYDGAGNIKKIDAAPFVYDSNTRLVSSTAGGKTEQYTYDEFGNILTISTSGSPIRRLGVDPDSNRMDQVTGIVGGQSVTFDMTAGYDGRGNVTSYNLDRFQYDGLNVLRKAHVAARWRSYVYNASDERIAVIEQTAEFGSEIRSDWTIRDALGQVLRRLSREAGQWQWNQDYIYRDGRMLASEVAGPAKRYQYHLDHLGTPRLITGNGGVEISRHTYLPFGTEVGAIPGQNPQDGEWKKFTGHERDQDSIDYMHARYYNPFMGRFLAVDPLPASAAPANPQSWNRYIYARNNPLNRVDRNGFIDVRCTEDQRITESELVLAVSSQLHHSTAKRVEYGAIVGVRGSVYGPFTSNDPGFVNPLLGIDRTASGPRVKGTQELPIRSMHTHLAAGPHPVPGTGQTWTALNPSGPSADDQELAKQTVPAYIVVPSERLLIKVNKDGSHEVILSGKDYDQWQERANAAREDRASDGTQQ